MELFIHIVAVVGILGLTYRYVKLRSEYIKLYDQHRETLNESFYNEKEYQKLNINLKSKVIELKEMLAFYEKECITETVVVEKPKTVRKKVVSKKTTVTE
jgi:hypothetical protein